MSKALSVTHAKLWTLIIPLALLFSGAGQAAEKADVSEPATGADGVPLTSIIDAVAKRTQKRFLVDPRVRASVAPEGLDMNKINYRELQAILRLNGFLAIEVGGAINVVPDSMMRYMPMPVIDKESSSLGDDDVVLKVFSAGKLDAARLIPLLRPLLPQYAHLAGYPDNNSIVIAGTYANVKTIEAVVRAMEKIPATSKSSMPMSSELPK